MTFWCENFDKGEKPGMNVLLSRTVKFIAQATSEDDSSSAASPSS
jgi:hypothetical protein